MVPLGGQDGDDDQEEEEEEEYAKFSTLEASYPTHIQQESANLIMMCSARLDEAAGGDQSGR